MAVTAPQQAIAVDANKNVGIGTDNPNSPLHISRQGGSWIQLENTDVGISWYVTTQNDGDFNITNDDTPGQQLFINADGNMGIGGDLGVGTNAPAAPLHVSNASGGGPGADLLVEDNGPARLHLKNISVTNSATADQEWSLNSNGALRITAGTDSPEFILDAAGKLTLPQQGSQLGIGTETPADQIHVVENGPAGIRLENTSVNQTWRLRAGNANNFVINDPNGNAPFTFTPGGDLGIGTTTPTADLHVRGSDDATDHGEIILETAITGQQWQLRSNNTTGEFVISDMTGTVTSPFKASIDANSNLLQLGNTASDEVNITGKLIISGTCTSESVDCASDYVFNPGYQIESIEDHAAAMWSNSYLPAVGPTPDNNGKGGPIAVNVLRKTTGMLNELEKAHIYIERLHERLKAKEAEAAELRNETSELREFVTGRLARLEARLEAQESRSGEEGTSFGAVR